ncbi:TaqI-like C-terminal specificity domain-containing protein [Bacteroides fragilis]
MSIKRKIETIGVPLKDWNIQINYGIKTGFNDAFIISTEKRDKILANCQTEEERQRTAELIRPILRGRDIKRYGYEWAGLWIINTHNGIKGKLPRIDVNEYPAIKAYLDQYWDKISIRADKGDTPYNLRNCAYMEDFNKPKIIWKRVGSILRFSYNDDGALGLDSTCFATGENIEFICCVLNSAMGRFLLKDAPKTGTGDLLISVQAVEPIKVPIITKEQNSIFEDSLKELTHYSSTQKEKEINYKVFELYNLSHDEQQYIESNFI